MSNQNYQRLAVSEAGLIDFVVLEVNAECFVVVVDIECLVFAAEVYVV